MSEKVAKKTLKRHKELGMPWHPESGLAFKSEKEKVVVGRIQDNAFIDLDEEACELCEQWGFKPDPSLIDEQPESAGAESVEEEEPPKKEEVPVPVVSKEVPKEDVPKVKEAPKEVPKEEPEEEPATSPSGGGDTFDSLFQADFQAFSQRVKSGVDKVIQRSLATQKELAETKAELASTKQKLTEVETKLKHIRSALNL